MPEIGEVARVVHYLRKHLVGRKIATVKVQEDEIVYGKVGTSASAFQAAITGKKVVGAKQQGKYFWLEMSSPPHPLMHLGMTGWMKFSNDDTAYYKPTKKEADDWPPKFWKFVLECEGKPECSVAFTDPRRLGRIRLVDVDAQAMRKTSPLKENGPDPVIDKDILTVEWLANKLRSKKVPVKALLLDQANISGVGNWVGDEVLFQARIHPEQYSNTFSDAQIKTLHDKLVEVCTIACDNLSDSSKFPDNWIMRHRWKKGKKESSRLPTGEKIIHLTVGGRTSAVVPSLQKKTGAVAGDISENEGGESATDDSGADDAVVETKPRRGSGKAKTARAIDGGKAKAKANPPSKRTRKSEDDAASENSEDESPSRQNKRPKASKASAEPKANGRAKSDVSRASDKSSKASSSLAEGRRRSSRRRN